MSNLLRRLFDHSHSKVLFFEVVSVMKILGKHGAIPSCLRGHISHPPAQPLATVFVEAEYPVLVVSQLENRTPDPDDLQVLSSARGPHPFKCV